VQALRLTAQRALAAHQEARQLGKELRTLVQAMAPVLLAQPGVGPVTAAQLLISWSHRGRLRSEAAFAMLAGAAPSRPRLDGWSATGSTGAGIAS
jgi:transposase